MMAVILAAGEGQRLQPLTSTKPKHLLPVGGTPLLQHMLLALGDLGVTDVAIIVGYLEDKIRGYFKDGSELGVSITYLKQEEPSGTAKAIGLAREYVGRNDFLVIYGDLLLGQGALTSVLKRYETDGSPVLSTVRVPNPKDFGVVVTKGRFLQRIVEKPTEDMQSDLVNAGIYLFSPDIFQTIEETRVSARGEYEITDTLQSLASRGVAVASCEISPTEWLDIGRPWDLLEANRRVLDRQMPEITGEVEAGVHISGSAVVKKGARVRSGAYLEGPVHVGEGCDVGPNCYIRPWTSLGNGVRVGNACEIKNSIIMNGTHIGHLSYVGDSVFGEDCNLGAGTITANLRLDDCAIPVTVRDRVVDSGQRKLGAFLGDGVKTSIGVSTMPGVRIGAGAWIGPGTIIRRDVPEKGRIGFETV
jgi:bifunctional UDP-N-acetylglucosamine pyrophosphorylase/glucosamine-1-phosphate N-acetyltransferase